MKENISFTERAIAKAQRLSINEGFCAALTAYLMRVGRMAYDFTHKLWFVNSPNEGWQVAVWMMAACEPLSEAERAAIAISGCAKGLA